MNISEIFIRRPIATSLLMAGIALFGVIAYRALPVSDLPQVDYPTLTVSAEPAGRQSGHHGVGGGHAAGTAVHHHRRPGLDDLQQQPGIHQHHPAVRPGPRHRRRHGGRGNGHRRSHAAAAAGHAHAALVPQGEPRRYRRSSASSSPRPPCGFPTWTSTPRP